MSAFLRKYGVAATVVGIPLITRSSADFKATPTLAAGDVTLSVDGGALANIGTLPAETTAGSGLLSFTLTSAELAGARIVVKLVDQTAAKEWEDQCFVVETYGHPSGQHAFDLDPLCGTVTTGADANTASAFYVDLASVTADYYNGCLLTFADGDLSGQVQKITDDHIKLIDEVFQAKEKEILEF